MRTETTAKDTEELITRETLGIIFSQKTDRFHNPYTNPNLETSRMDPHTEKRPTNQKEINDPTCRTKNVDRTFGLLHHPGYDTFSDSKTLRGSV
jgi:hypothetical protein